MKKYVQIVSVLLCATLLFAGIAPNFTTSKTTPIVRSMGISASEMDNQSALIVFDSYEVNLLEEEGKANFVGYKEFLLSDLYDLDLISESESSSRIQTRFETEYDYENGVVTLTAIVDDGESQTVLDKIYGLIILNELEQFDVMFDVDGETVLLSEMAAIDSVDTCGLFSKIWGTTVGKVGTIITVAACAAVGVVCAVIPGGQLVTAICIGAAVGFVGAATTAALSTYVSDGVVDWYAVIEYGFTGLFVGGGISAASFSIACNVIGKGSMKTLLKAADNNPKSGTTFIGKYIEGSSKSYEAVAKSYGGNYFNLNNWNTLVAKYGAQAMNRLNKLWLQAKILLGNTIILTSDPTNPQNLTGAFKEELEWLAEAGLKHFVKIGEGLWQAVK